MTREQIEAQLDIEGAIMDDPAASVEEKVEALNRMTPLIFAYSALIAEENPGLADVAEQVADLSHALGTNAPVSQEQLQKLSRDARREGAALEDDTLSDAGERLLRDR